jgi:hypothetical protein
MYDFIWSPLRKECWHIRIQLSAKQSQSLKFSALRWRSPASSLGLSPHRFRGRNGGIMTVGRGPPPEEGSLPLFYPAPSLGEVNQP